MYKQIILTLLLLLPIIIAYEGEGIESIYDGWVPQAGNLTADGQTFFVQSTAADGLRAAIMHEGETVIILNQTCEEKEPYIFCYEGTKFLEYNQEVDKAVDQFKIIIRKKVPNIEFTKRETSNSEPYLWEEFDITTRFENTGIIDVKEANFSENFNNLFWVVKATGCQHNLTDIWWSGAMPQNKEVECTYTIRSVNVTSRTNYGHLTHGDGSGLKTINTPGLKISVQEPMINITSKISVNKTARLGEEVFLEVILTNIADESSASISKFEITHPPGSKLIQKGKNLFLDGRTLRWSGKLPPNTKTRINMTFVPEQTGDNSVHEDLLYFIGGKRIDNRVTEPLEVLVDFINITLKFEGDNASGVTTEPIKIMAVNQGWDDVFKDITVTLTSPIPGISGTYPFDRIATKNHQIVLDDGFTMPQVENLTYIPINATVEYYSEYGERFFRTYDFSIPTFPGNPIDEGNQTDSGVTPEGSTTQNETTAEAAKEPLIDKEKLRPLLYVLSGIAILLVLIFASIKLFHRKQGFRLKEELMKGTESAKEEKEDDKPVQNARDFMDKVEKEAAGEIEEAEKKDELPPAEIDAETEPKEEEPKAEPKADPPKKEPVKEDKPKKLKKTESFRF